MFFPFKTHVDNSLKNCIEEAKKSTDMKQFKSFGYKVLTRNMRSYVLKNMTYEIGKQYYGEAHGFWAYKDKNLVVKNIAKTLNITEVDAMKKLYNGDLVVYLCEGILSTDNPTYNDNNEIEFEIIKLVEEICPLVFIDEDEVIAFKDYFDNKEYDNFIKYIANLADKEFNVFTKNFILTEAKIDKDEKDYVKTLHRVAIMRTVEEMDISNDKKIDLYLEMTKKEGL